MRHEFHAIQVQQKLSTKLIKTFNFSQRDKSRPNRLVTGKNIFFFVAFEHIFVLFVLVSSEESNENEKMSLNFWTLRDLFSQGEMRRKRKEKKSSYEKCLSYTKMRRSKEEKSRKSIEFFFLLWKILCCCCVGCRHRNWSLRTHVSWIRRRVDFMRVSWLGGWFRLHCKSWYTTTEKSSLLPSLISYCSQLFVHEK